MASRRHTAETARYLGSDTAIWIRHCFAFWVTPQIWRFRCVLVHSRDHQGRKPLPFEHAGRMTCRSLGTACLGKVDKKVGGATRGTMACLGQDPDKVLRHNGRGIVHCGVSLKTPKAEGKYSSDPLVLFLSGRISPSSYTSIERRRNTHISTWSSSRLSLLVTLGSKDRGKHSKVHCVH